jgi:putative acetyltransferase
MSKIITYQVAQIPEEFEAGKKLFTEYALSLNVDLSFQNFEKEFENIQTQYGNPEGALILALDNEVFAGCAGVRQLDGQTAELKRMYVKNEYRGYRTGLGLLQHAIEIAMQLGYTKIRLDTLENMTKARQLYNSFGFYQIPSYRFNPLPGTIYMERLL